MILKGLLLWVTTFVVILLISGIDSIADQGYLVPWLMVCALLCCLCCKLISVEELEVLSGAKWLDRKFNLTEE